MTNFYPPREMIRRRANPVPGLSAALFPGRAARVASAFCLLILGLLPGCGSPGEEKAPEPARKYFRMSGTLLYRPLPRTKSLRAYLGHEFFLIQEGKKRQTALQPSARVDRASLLRYRDKNVTIIGYFYDGRRPDPRSSYPLDRDGKPLRQGSGFKVTRISSP